MKAAKRFYGRPNEDGRRKYYMPGDEITEPIQKEWENSGLVAKPKTPAAKKKGAPKKAKKEIK